MIEKRFKMKKLEYESYFIDSQQEYVDKDEPKLKIDGERTMSDSQILDLLNENEQLKAQLYYDSEEGVCSICKHHYLENQSLYYISKCEKGHEECSTDALKHCTDFELKELQE